MRTQIVPRCSKPPGRVYCRGERSVLRSSMLHCNRSAKVQFVIFSCATGCKLFGFGSFRKTVRRCVSFLNARTQVAASLAHRRAIFEKVRLPYIVSGPLAQMVE